MEATVDCKYGILTGVDVRSANQKESLLILRHLEKQIAQGVPMQRIALDKGYDTGAVHRGLELLGITGYIPAIQFSNSPEKYGFTYKPELDAFVCPKEKLLLYRRLNCNKSTGKYLRCYQAAREDCQTCSNRQRCLGTTDVRAEYWQVAAIRLSFGDIAVLEVKNILQCCGSGKFGSKAAFLFSRENIVWSIFEKGASRVLPRNASFLPWH